ncbi:hypothetical protein, partial [Marivivens marinus]|uniref:hypothetical protein n=1 Tax=Marivivens marinus TaxID=3110173 RepID=UPI003B846D08
KHRSDGPEAHDALTIKPDHPMGARQSGFKRCPAIRGVMPNVRIQKRRIGHTGAFKPGIVTFPIVGPSAGIIAEINGLSLCASGCEPGQSPTKNQCVNTHLKYSFSLLTTLPQGPAAGNG